MYLLVSHSWYLQIYPGTDGRQIDTDNGEEPSANATTAGMNLSSVQMTKALFFGK